ncbi:argininosuccinate lyase [Rhizobium sp. NBRC 114257]|uniref:Argininosuccinate lyase n=1 Tax=Rhizobium dioscoreae TaxID=2653122 RepID=A0ABQ0Z9C6_9HYPH|nr:MULTISPECIES: argininosuccinate lyase [Rhizobium]GES52156.1 argininosuccinate lyase [Rhizobium dioscoreae]GLU83125.1 argininosuccinate lyase [Rhizobium sp. NBRC 114257]
MRNQKEVTWSPLFKEAVSRDFESFHECLDQDKRIALHDVAGSKVHAEMLARAGILTAEDNAQIQAGLDKVAEEMRSGAFEWKTELEDVHTNVEDRLIALIGDAGKKLHTARSRNDQVATDIRLYAREQLDLLAGDLKTLIGAFVDLAEKHADAIMPGFTHLQVAQPVTFGHHLMAYVEMFLRDLDRVGAARERLNISPLGAAALAGTGYPIDPEYSASKLGFSTSFANSLDAVSDRDYVVDVCSAGSIIMGHLSRFSEEVILWCTPMFGFIEVGDQFCTGSSIMPQKRNPDLAELVRGKAARVMGNLAFSAALMKSQPLAFNKDQQESKPPLTDTLETVRAAVSVTAQMIPTITVKHARMLAAATQGYSTATDLADYLVRAGVPFRDAHHAVAAIVGAARDKALPTLSELSLAEMQAFAPGLREDVFEVLTVEGSVASRDHKGGTAPRRVRQAIETVRRAIA